MQVLKKPTQVRYNVPAKINHAEKSCDHPIADAGAQMPDSDICLAALRQDGTPAARGSQYGPEPVPAGIAAVAVTPKEFGATAPALAFRFNDSRSSI